MSSKNDEPQNSQAVGAPLAVASTRQLMLGIAQGSEDLLHAEQRQ